MLIVILNFSPGIRDYIISKSVCVCGAANILADDLLPNQTTRELISRIMETGTTSAENAGSAFQVQGYWNCCNVTLNYYLSSTVIIYIVPLVFDFFRYGVCSLSTAQDSFSNLICCV